METNALGNVKINEDYALCTVNPKLFLIDAIYSAAYMMMDKAYIVLDGNPETEIKVEIRKKNNNTDLKDLAIEFNEQLLNYSVYAIQNERNRNIRELILKKALEVNKGRE